MADLKLRTILGTMEFGRRLSLGESEKMVKAFIKAQPQCAELDAAFMYAGGKTEEFIGKMNCSAENNVQIATKANPWDGKLLDAQGVRMQLETTLKRLQLDSVHLFYLHCPDHKTPIIQTLKAVNDLYTEKKFKEFGLSNFAAWQVSEIYTICKNEGWVLPTVYQGMYNCLTRAVERELFACLRNYGLRFYAYNPLCGGLLTGKHKFQDADKNEPGRFFGKAQWAEVYRKRFWKVEVFDAIDKVQRILNDVYGEGNVSMAEASYRWLYHHSAMDGKYNDGVIIGSSTTDHFTANLGYSMKEKLDERVLDVLEECWAACSYSSANYMR